MGERALSKIQWGLETLATHGTAVAADTRLLAKHPPIPPDRAPEMIEDDNGTRAEGTRTRVDQYLVEDTLTFDHAYFQLLPILFSMGIKGNITPVLQTTGQGDYLWTHTPSLVASNTPDSGTIELGDDIDCIEREYMMLKRLKIACNIGQGMESSPVSIEAEYFARQNTKASFTAAIAIPTVENINGKLTRFYLDTTWAGVGGTEKTGLLRGYEIDIVTGLHPKFMGGANKYFDTHGEGKFTVSARVTLEGSAAADDIYDAFISRALQVLQFSITGSQIASGESHNLTFAVSGEWMAFTKMAENNQGNNLSTALLRGKEDLTASQLFTLTALTNVASI